MCMRGKSRESNTKLLYSKPHACVVYCITVLYFRTISVMHCVIRVYVWCKGGDWEEEDWGEQIEIVCNWH